MNVTDPLLVPKSTQMLVLNGEEKPQKSALTSALPTNDPKPGRRLTVLRPVAK